MVGVAGVVDMIAIVLDTVLWRSVRLCCRCRSVYPFQNEELFMKIRVRFAGAMAAVLFMLTVAAGDAQTATQPVLPPAAAPDVIQTEPELLNFADLAARATPLLDKARAGNGSASITLAHYPGHFTMLSARTASGGAELHKRYADFLFVLAGEGTELTGGTIVDRRDVDDGEVKGRRLEGAVPRVLHKGDVIHIPAGTPHQAIEGPGQTIVTFVIKVQVPAGQP
jgi:mannose-6-phosphate isomerase-like protein (cupin superfamily)